MSASNNQNDGTPAFETTLRPGVLYEAPLSTVWRMATGSSYGDHFDPDDMGQYVLMMATDEQHPEGMPWLMDTQSINRDADQRLANAISQDGIIEATAERNLVPLEFVMECQSRHYYRKCVPVESSECEAPFAQVADLRDWQYATEDEADEMRAKDPSSVIDKVSLFFQHGWQWQTGKRGISIMRKGDK